MHMQHIIWTRAKLIFRCFLRVIVPACGCMTARGDGGVSTRRDSFRVSA
jgi:hypothetical protein